MIKQAIAFLLTFPPKANVFLPGCWLVKNHYIAKSAKIQPFFVALFFTIYNNEKTHYNGAVCC
jgi:hypothetical protein